MPLGKLIKTSSQHISRNFGLAFASVIVMTLTFLISSEFGIMFISTDKLIDYAEKQLPIVVIIENNSSAEQIKLVEDTIKSINPNVETKYNDSNVSYKKYLSDNANNPALTYDVSASKLPAFINVNLDNQKDILNLYTQLLNTIGTKTDKNISDLQKEKTKYFTVGKDLYILKDNFKFVDTAILQQSTSIFLTDLRILEQVVGIAHAIFLATVSIIIIFVTTGMAIYINREEIETMELVGATPLYVRLPYIFDGALFGFLGSLISSCLLFGLGYFYVNSNSTNIVIQFIKRFFVGVDLINLSLLSQILIFIGLLLTGAFIGALASSFATKRYLK